MKRGKKELERKDKWPQRNDIKVRADFLERQDKTT